MRKLWLAEEYCPKDHYHCLMPVAYESVEEDGMIKEYRRVGIACRHVNGEGCENQETCPFIAAAPEVLEKNAHWYEN